MTTTSAPRRSRRILAPLATLAAAGALVVGSGASFTSQSQNPTNIVTSGILDQTNSRNGEAIFNVANLKPGDSVKGDVTIKNSGTLPAVFTVKETATTGFVPGSLKMTVVQTGVATPIFSGTFGDLGGDDDILELGNWAVGESRTFTYTVTLDPNAGEADEGKTATATYTWDGIQTTTPVNTDQTGDVDDTNTVAQVATNS